jgi:hypothetical protein
MQVKSRTNLEAKAASIFNDLEAGFLPCEIVYILSELAKLQSLAMLQREQNEGVN